MPNLKVLHSFSEVEDDAIDTCTTCPKLCRWACPVAETEARETTTPWNLMVTSGFVKKGYTAVDQVGALPYHCTHCGACTEACLHNNDVPLILSMTRSRVLSGHAAPEAVVEVRGHFGTAANPYGVPLDGAMKTIDAEARSHSSLPPSGALLYMPGCATIHEMPEAATAFLHALGVYGISGVAVTEASSSCCGLSLLWAGDLNGFRAHALRHASRLANADTVIVHDSACAHAMAVRYPEFGVQLSPQVVHVSSFLASNLSTTTTSKITAERIAYSDSCSLARGLSLREEPRAILERVTGAPVCSLPEIRGNPLDCCGAGGLLPLTAPHTATEMAEAKIQTFRASGADRLAMFNPRCAAHLKRVDPTVDVIDGSMLLARV